MWAGRAERAEQAAIPILSAGAQSSSSLRAPARPRRESFLRRARINGNARQPRAQPRAPVKSLLGADFVLRLDRQHQLGSQQRPREAGAVITAPARRTTEALQMPDPAPGHPACGWLWRTRLMSGQEAPACHRCATLQDELLWKKGRILRWGFPRVRILHKIRHSLSRSTGRL